MFEFIKSLLKKLKNRSKISPEPIHNPTDISISLSTSMSLAKTVDSRVTPGYSTQRYWATYVAKPKDPNNIFEPR